MPYYIKRKVKEKPAARKKRQPSLSTLVNKLDKVFSQYIRLRDAMPSGVFRCISCGQIKPIGKADCGHFYSRRHMSTRFDEDNCNAECSYCLTPDALILTADLKWKPLGELQEGDKLFGFEEVMKHKTSRRYKTSIVTHLHREVQDVFAVELENGDIVKTTAQHKWLARGRQSTAYQWIETQQMWINGVNMYGKHKSGPHTDRTTTIVCKPFQVVEQDYSYDSGWLAGMIDADGHITQQNIHNSDGTLRYGLRIGIAQCEKYPEHCKKIVELIEKFTGNNKPCRQWMRKKDDTKHGIHANYQSWQFIVTGTNAEKLQFLMRIRPNKMSKIDIDKLGKLKSQYDIKVKSITPLGKQEIVVMETSTHTFIANGYAMHNCNRFNAEHLKGYQDNLIRKIGMQRFQLLSVRANETKKWSCFEIEALIKHYQGKVKELEKEKGIRL